MLKIILDKENIYLLDKYKWHLKQGYARTTYWKDKKWHYIMLHRLVMDAKPGDVVDHINGNRLDNRKCNLRFVSIKENNCNRHAIPTNNKSGYRGVSFHRGKWRATFASKHLGYFDSPEEAHKFITDWRLKNVPTATS